MISAIGLHASIFICFGVQVLYGQDHTIVINGYDVAYIPVVKIGSQAFHYEPHVTEPCG